MRRRPPEAVERKQPHCPLRIGGARRAVRCVVRGPGTGVLDQHSQARQRPAACRRPRVFRTRASRTPRAARRSRQTRKHVNTPRIHGLPLHALTKAEQAPELAELAPERQSGLTPEGRPAGPRDGQWRRRGGGAGGSARWLARIPPAVAPNSRAAAGLHCLNARPQADG